MPDGWAWTKAKCLYNIRSAIRIHQTDWQSSGIPFFRGRELVELCKTGKVHPEIYISEELYEQNKSKGGIPQKNDLLVSAVGTLGFVHIVEGTKKFYYKDAYILCFENKFNLNPKYTKLVIESDYTQKVIYGGSKGTTVDQLTIENAKELWIPFPPLSEQEKIVSQVENIFLQVHNLEQDKSDLQIIIKQTKSKILDLAIHGKLVPQDPNDEPAEELLKRIATSDNRPYKKFEGEVSFDIPESWIWMKLPDLCTMSIKDGTHKTPTYADKENGILFLSSKDVTSGKIDWSKIKYITKELHEELYKRIAPQKNDILLAKNGTTGVAALVEDDTIFDIYVSLAVIRPDCDIVNPQYLLSIINSQFCKNQFDSHLLGIGVPNLHLNEINKTSVPLPPIAEQNRIVSKIEELFSSLDIISTNLE